MKLKGYVDFDSSGEIDDFVGTHEKGKEFTVEIEFSEGDFPKEAVLLLRMFGKKDAYLKLKVWLTKTKGEKLLKELKEDLTYNTTPE